MVTTKEVSERENREMVGTYYQRNDRIIFQGGSGQQSSYFEGSKCRQCRDTLNNIPNTHTFRIWEYQGYEKKLKIPKADRGKKKEMYGRMRRKLAPDVSSSSIIN